MAAQIVLSLRLVWRNTAFGDEALYLWSGHLEISHWANGTPVPQFQTWFSGSPVIYPPIGAVADSIGGLAAARLLSLGFMLGATLFLYGVIKFFFGRRAAIFGCAVFASLGPEEVLSAFATYDAMALFLLALATWLALRFSSRIIEPALILAASIVVLANATKYASALWDPAVAALVTAAALDRYGWRIAVFRGARFSFYILVFLGGALKLGGPSYVAGILFTTVARTASTSPASLVLHQGINYIGAILVLSLLAVLACISDKASVRLVCVTGITAAALPILNQARIHTTTSLQKHVVFGAWFAAIAAGYLLARISRVDTRRGWLAAVGLATVVPIVLIGLGQAVSLYSYWPNSAGYISALRPLACRAGGQFLMEEFDVGYYYLPRCLYPGQVTSMFGYLYWDQSTRTELTGKAALVAGIINHDFTVVEVDGQNIPPSTTLAVESALKRSDAYRLVYRQPFIHNGLTHQIEIWRLAAFRGAG